MRPDREIRLVFQPGNHVVWELPGTDLTEAAGRAGLILRSPCGGNGTCGKCAVRFAEGAPSPCQADAAALSEDDIEAGWRLACQAVVEAPAVIETPADSLLSDHQQILTDDTWERGELNPVIRKLYFELDPPSREHPEADFTRLRNAVGPVQVSLTQLRHLPAFLRRNHWRGTAVLAGKWLIRLEEGDTSREFYGVAFDIGTTTVVGTLMDLRRNLELAAVSEMNPQVAYGNDVLTRIMRVRESPEALGEMQRALVETLNDILGELADREHVGNHRIYDITVAGNSTMQQILCGLDCAPLGEVPFTQVFDQSWRFNAADIGLKANPQALLYVFPQIGGFVGGDTVAGLLATLHGREDSTFLLVDIGTNGELVLSHGDHLYAASTAAGPALEGARILAGMRARNGAIEKVVINHEVQVNVIGNAAPVGICGTALIDAVAELLRIGVIDTVGRLLPDEDLPDGLSADVRARLQGDGKERRFILVEADDSGTRHDICLWQSDIQELQLAAGAIRAGIRVLLRKLDLTPSDLDEVLLAGAFGNYIRRANARRIGLLPQIPCRRIHFVGNAASLGAKLALLSMNQQRRADAIRRDCDHIDLSLDPDFQTEFADAMLFPTGETLDTCPD